MRKSATTSGSLENYLFFPYPRLRLLWAEYESIQLTIQSIELSKLLTLTIPSLFKPILNLVLVQSKSNS